MLWSYFALNVKKSHRKYMYITDPAEFYFMLGFPKYEFTDFFICNVEFKKVTKEQDEHLLVEKLR